jgi:hypothetical protein
MLKKKDKILSHPVDSESDSDLKEDIETSCKSSDLISFVAHKMLSLPEIQSEYCKLKSPLLFKEQSVKRERDNLLKM